MLSLAGFVSACGDKNVGRTPSEVAAKVNKHEIFVYQINDVLQRAGPIAPGQTKRATSEVLERLINEELLVQEAQENKLDRTVPVLEAVEAAKRDIYARAYIDQFTSQVAGPDSAEVAKFFDSNPDLFAKRRIYTLEQIGAQPFNEQMTALVQRVGAAKTMDEVADWLRAQNIPYTSDVGIKSAEELPMDVLPSLAALKPGMISVLKRPGGIIIVCLVESHEQPLDLKTATPMIEQIITNRRKNELMKRELKRLRDDSSIEYFGEFAGSQEMNASAGAALGTAHGAAAQIGSQPAKAPNQDELRKGAARLK